jgi:hypothetical protein
LVQASILHFPSTLQSSDWDQACAIMWYPWRWIWAVWPLPP